MTFKAGDRVRCIWECDSQLELTLGKVYTVSDADHLSIALNGSGDRWSMRRFEPAERLEKLESIATSTDELTRDGLTLLLGGVEITRLVLGTTEATAGYIETVLRDGIARIRKVHAESVADEQAGRTFMGRPVVVSGDPELQAMGESIEGGLLLGDDDDGPVRVKFAE